MSDDACKRCGTDKPAHTLCSRCGGHGLVHGAMGDVDDCPDCGCSGIQWPPRCECGAFRKEQRT